MEAFDGLVRDALLVTAAIALPILAAAAIAATLVALLQAATQVQEQTLSFLPKLVVVGAILAAFGTTALHVLARLFRDAVATLPAILGS